MSSGREERLPTPDEVVRHAARYPARGRLERPAGLWLFISCFKADGTVFTLGVSDDGKTLMHVGERESRPAPYPKLAVGEFIPGLTVRPIARDGASVPWPWPRPNERDVHAPADERHELVALRAKLVAYEHVLRQAHESDPWAMASSTLAELGIDVERTACPCPACAKGGEL